MQLWFRTRLTRHGLDKKQSEELPFGILTQLHQLRQLSDEAIFCCQRMPFHLVETLSTCYIACRHWRKKKDWCTVRLFLYFMLAENPINSQRDACLECVLPEDLKETSCEILLTAVVGLCESDGCSRVRLFSHTVLTFQCTFCHCHDIHCQCHHN